MLTTAKTITGRLTTQRMYFKKTPKSLKGQNDRKRWPAARESLSHSVQAAMIAGHPADDQPL